MCTRITAKIVIGLTYLIPILLNIDTTIIYDVRQIRLRRNMTTLRCSSDKKFNTYLEYRRFANATISFFIPILTITVNYIIVVVAILKMYRRFQKTLNTNANGSNTEQRRFKNLLRIIGLFLTTGLFYLLTNLPACIYFRIINVKFTKPNDIVGKIIGSIFIFNYSMNFYLYILGGPSFREEFLAMLRCNRGGESLSKESNGQHKTIEENVNHKNSTDPEKNAVTVREVG